MSVEKVGYATYRVYWESQHGDDPMSWCAANEIPCSVADDPEFVDELWPYQSAYIIIVEGSPDQIDLFESQY